VEDVNQISVSPSTVTNMTIDGDDEWSMGSMFSFGKKRRQRKQNRPDALSQVSADSRQSKGHRGSSKTRQDGILSRKVSFDDQKKNIGRKHGQLSFRRSPREQVRPHNTKESNNDKTGSPNIEFDDQELQWKIQNHISTEDASQSNVVLTIHVSDARERVLIQNCHGVSVQIHGRKMKSMMICDCSDLNVVFDTVSNTCDIVHCKHVAIQTTGVCPTFAMERTKGVTVWLSVESMKVSNIVTSKCTEVNVSLPRGSDDNDYDRRELALPERYVHQFSGGEMKSRVSSVCR
jgi:Adenylate cyclase associated (CAP) C terminal